MNIQEDIDDIIAENGPLTQQSIFPENSRAEYNRRVQELLLTFWKQHGLGSWKGGLFFLIDPNEMSGLLSQIFYADPDFSYKDSWIIG